MPTTFFHATPRPGHRGRWAMHAVGVAAAALAIAACGSSATPVGPSGAAASPSPTSTLSASEAAGTGTTGDIPDNAVFLTYADPSGAFSIQYVEGWQVASGSSGVTIRDKDSSETVDVAALPPDLKAFAAADLTSLRKLAGFSLVAQDAVSVASASYGHVQYLAMSRPDPVTGKQVPSILDRYYVPGASKLAVVTLSTPVGVDNLDAFRQMIGSFAWH